MFIIVTGTVCSLLILISLLPLNSHRKCFKIVRYRRIPRYPPIPGIPACFQKLYSRFSSVPDISKYSVPGYRPVTAGTFPGSFVVPIPVDLCHRTGRRSWSSRLEQNYPKADATVKFLFETFISVNRTFINEL